MKFTVSGLPKAFNQADLKALFVPFGIVTFCSVYFDPITHQSRGSGVVRMPQTSEAEAAIRRLQGYVLENAALKFTIEEDIHAAAHAQEPARKQRARIPVRKQPW